MPETERRLVIMRHAKSAWPQGVADVHRPLAERGLRDAPAVGRWLRAHVPTLALAVCSPANRVWRTWQLAAGELDPAPAARQDRRIYDGQLLDVVTDLPAEVHTVALVGHNPALEELVEVCTGTEQVLKTSAIAVLVTHQRWAEAGPGWASLASHAKPRG